MTTCPLDTVYTAGRHANSCSSSVVYISDWTKTGSAFEVKNEISPKDVHAVDTSIVNVD